MMALISLNATGASTEPTFIGQLVNLRTNPDSLQFVYRPVIRCTQSPLFRIDLSVNKFMLNKNNELHVQNPYFRTSLMMIYSELGIIE